MRALYWKDVLGEIVGTFILVFFGLGIITVSTLFGAALNLFQLAVVWGTAVTLGIYCVRHLSDGHLNPAVSVAMTLLGRMRLRQCLLYIPCQIFGAFLAAATLYLLFGGMIGSYEAAHGITRGAPESIATARMFGAYFPNELNPYGISYLGAVLAEAFGTFTLIMMALLITENKTAVIPDTSFSPVFLGLTVAAIVTIIGPLSSCSINPARDLGPKLFMVLAGWGRIAIPGPREGAIFVYVLSPILGAIVASLVFAIIRPVIYREG